MHVAPPSYGEFEPDLPQPRRPLPSRPSGPVQFLHDVVRQMRAVAWPTAEAASRAAAVVLLTLLLVIGYLLVVDVATVSFVDRITGR